MNAYRNPHPSSWQHTLAGEFTCVGRGLHGGRRVRMRLQPALPDSGIRFVRVDVASPRREVLADWRHVVEAELCTTLANACGVTVRTVEHLLAALHATGIDNASVELDGPEVPIMDGSAAPYVALLESIGRRRQGVARRSLVITKPVVAADGDRYATFLPHPECRVSVEIDFPSSAIGRQRYSTTLGSDAFARDVAPARTFGFAHELRALQARGLARGGSLQSAVLLDGARVVNEEGLRFPDEFARHKLLDCVGDLALLGMPVVGHLVAHKPGHRLCHRLLRALNAAGETASVVVDSFDDIDFKPWLGESVRESAGGEASRSIQGGTS